MRKVISKEVNIYLARNHRYRAWKKVVSALACVVVFCTTYAMILPAITLEKRFVCGGEEHTHTDNCYTRLATESRVKPICTPESLPLHKHREDCVDECGKYVCGYADFIVHEHDASCFDGDGNLWCPLREIKAHTHDEGCYTQPETEPVHTHTEECYVREQNELICTIPEGDGAHAHSVEAGCFDENGELVCQTEESAGHRHTDGCYTWNEVLSCDLPTVPSEAESCVEPVLTCGKEEILLHRHTEESCFQTDEDGNTHLICEKLQVLEHTHTEACFQTVEEPVDTEALTCAIPEGEGAHTHSTEAGCYDESGTLTCQEEESAGHRHGPLCYGTWVLTCGLEEHTHTGECTVSPEPAENALPDADAAITQPGIPPQAAGDGPPQENLLPGDVAYIGKLAMGTTDQDTSNGITDGASPWDPTDSDGCDTGPRNLRVRTFGTVNYDFYYQTALHDPQDTTQYPGAYFCFEFLLPVDRSQAYFDVDGMEWLSGSDVYYRYEPTPITANGVSYQVLHGTFLDQREGSTITAASRSRNVSIRVLNMKNGSTIQPIFSMWMRVNDVGITRKSGIPQSIAYRHGYDCSTHHQDEVISLLPEPVTVTCTPRYDITLKRGENASTSWTGDFDFSTGNNLAIDKDIGTWNGRMSAYGIRLMVKGVDAEHGLRGCAFPEPGDTLEFDITLTTAWQDSNGGDWQYVTEEFVPRVWSTEEFSNADTQKDGREISATKLPSYAAPLNQGSDAAVSCANGGTWTFTDMGHLDNNPNHRRIHVEVTDYTFDPTHLPYANERDAGNPEFYNPEAIGDQFWNIEQAVFSTGEMWVVTPFYNQPGADAAHYITNVKNTSSLTMWQSIFANHIRVKDGSNSQKFYDDWADRRHLDSSITLQEPGTFNAQVFMVKPINCWDVPLTEGCREGENELKDFATPGTYADLEAILLHDGAEGDAVGVAYNLMVKFDNAFFEPVTWKEARPAGYPDQSSDGTWGGFRHDLNTEEFPYAGHTWTTWPNYTVQPDYVKDWNPWGPKMLYGTTRDKKGWDHKGQKPDGQGYDEAMMKAAPDDLIWYDSMEALKADGAECVAVLMEYRNVGNDGNNPEKSTMNHLHMTVHGKIKETAEPGYVYAVSNYAAVWTKSDVKQFVTDASGDGQIGTMDYLHYSQHDFPSYSPSAGSKMNSASFPAPSNERSWKRCTDIDGDHLSGANGYGTSVKSSIDENGNFHTGSGGHYFQDNVYVISYHSEIGIQVAQTDSTGTSKSIYSMDFSERVVDFKMTPRMIRNSTDAGTGGETTTQYADVTLTATLPKGLEYYSGTATWGGEYAQDGSCKEPGQLTGGQALETTVTPNSDGTMTLTWVLKNIPLANATEDLDPIYFSCRIGDSTDPAKDVTNGQFLNVRADVYSTMDPGAVHGTVYNNQANTSIAISKSVSLTIIKTADQPLVNLGDSMGFTMKLYNGSESPYEGWIADILPMNGVGENSFSGSCRVEAFRIVSGVDVSNVKFYYTTNPEDGKATDVTDLNPDGRNWTEFTLDSNQTWRPGEMKDPITAIAYRYAIPGSTTIEMHIELSLPDGAPGDIIHNHLLLNHLVSSDRSQVVTRTLEGLTWLDGNANGIQDEADSARLSGVKTTLMKLKEGTIFSTAGSTDPILTLKRESTYQGLKAEDIRQVRVVASGPVGSAIQLYYASSGAGGLSEGNSIKQTIVQGTSEYVFDMTGRWSGDIWDLRLDPFDKANASGIVESITLILTDGTTRRFDLSVSGNSEKYLTLTNCGSGGNYHPD